jgi:DNA-binding CsgD family transcriptional regulator
VRAQLRSASVLIGRSAERVRIDGVLAEARAGSRRILVVQGEAGVGKTALLDYARERGRGMRQLRLTGVESEAELAFAGLTELLLPLMDQLDALPAVQADALRCALAIHAEPVNPLAVRVGLLNLLAFVAEATPLLIAVDDAQWVDDSSMAAITFAVRRLEAEPIALLVATRREEVVSVRPGDDVYIALRGLPEAEARQLLAARFGHSGPGTDPLLAVAGGNPLALLELPDDLEPGDGAAPDGLGPPPVGPRVHEAFHDRVDRLPAACRLALGAVAADGTATVGEVQRMLHELGFESDVLLPAELDGLLTVDTERVTLRHPLLRSVAYHGLPGPDRRRVHAAFAATLLHPAHVERRTWHRAAAAVGPDDDIAAALDELALAAERRCALSTASRCFARAASLSADDDARARRFHAAAVAREAAGHWQLALDLLDQAMAYAYDPALRSDVAASIGKLEIYRSGPEKGALVLIEAAESIEADDPERATRLYAYASSAAIFAADATRAIELAERAVATSARTGGMNMFSGAIARAYAGLLAGDPSVRPVLEALDGWASGLMESDLVDAEHVFSIVVLAAFVLESWDRAQELLDMMLRHATDTGRTFLLAFVLMIRSEIELRRGRWSAAYATVTNDVWDTMDLPGIGPWLHAVQARIEAGLGLADEAERHAIAALTAAVDTGTHAVASWARASLGFLDLGRGRPERAVEHLEAVALRLEQGAFLEPGVLWWAADLVEAHWRSGDADAARRRLDMLQAQADTTGRAWANATAARGAGLLATTAADMEAAFADALDWHDHLDAPFERARTLLCLGERRLGLGLDGAHGPVREALSTFEQLGAEPWIAQARALLGARPAPSIPVRLTRAERQVAVVVGRGATNREAAAELFLSTRTIDFHLRNIYKKLQIRSRTELAVHMATQEPPS